jgi:hypothetical protein
MKVRFQADADLDQRIVSALLRREPSLDFQTASAANLAGREDPEVLAIAASAGRVLVSHDLRTMPKHFSTFVLNQTSPGLIVIPQRMSIAAAAEDLLVVWLLTDAQEWVNRISILPL